MRKEIAVIIAIALALLATNTLIAQHSHSEHPPSVGVAGDHDQEQDHKQRYTCRMHPEVITDHPGNCPKCGMKLVPLAQQKRSTSNVQRPTSNVEAIDLNRPRHAHSHPPSPGYGAPGTHEHVEMQMEMSMHSSIDLA